MNKKDQKDLTILGLANFRNAKKVFGIKLDDRRRHIYIVGKTGSGKSTLLENMAIDDIRAGRGVGVVDPHGEFAERVLDFVPEERVDDVIYFNPADLDFPIAFNPLEQVGNEFRHLVASGIMGVFKKIWPDAWSARMEYILNNTLLALLEYPNSTILGIMRMFSQPEYRKKIVSGLQDPVIKAFWAEEFARYNQRFETEALAAIQNKVGQFVSNPLIRNILGQSSSALKMRKIMDEGKILVVNLSKGRIGEDNSALLGAMIITRLQLAAMSRVDVPEEKRRDFFLYVDEFQNFATDSFANILSEARKYHLSLTLAHQYIGQLDGGENTHVRDAIFGNVGTLITFRVGAVDGEFLEKEFMPEFVQNDLVNLAKYNVYLKLMIDGMAQRPFSAETIPPPRQPLISYRDVIIENSQKRYGTPRKIVEERISDEWMAGAQVVDDRISRRGEQSLSAILKPRPAREGEFRSKEAGQKPPNIDRANRFPERTNITLTTKPENKSASKPENQHLSESKISVEPQKSTQPPAHIFPEIETPPPIPYPKPKELPRQQKREIDLDDLRNSISESLSRAVSEKKSGTPIEKELLKEHDHENEAEKKESNFEET